MVGELEVGIGERRGEIRRHTCPVLSVKVGLDVVGGVGMEIVEGLMPAWVDALSEVVGTVGEVSVIEPGVEKGTVVRKGVRDGVVAGRFRIILVELMLLVWWWRLLLRYFYFLESPLYIFLLYYLIRYFFIKFVYYFCVL